MSSCFRALAGIGCRAVWPHSSPSPRPSISVLFLMIPVTWCELAHRPPSSFAQLLAPEIAKHYLIMGHIKVFFLFAKSGSYLLPLVAGAQRICISKAISSPLGGTKISCCQGMAGIDDAVAGRNTDSLSTLQHCGHACRHPRLAPDRWNHCPSENISFFTATIPITEDRSLFRDVQIFFLFRARMTHVSVAVVRAPDLATS